MVLGLEEGSEHKVTLVTVVPDHSELRQDTSAAAHHTTGSDQLVQVELPEEKMQDYLPAERLRQPCFSYQVSKVQADMLVLWSITFYCFTKDRCFGSSPKKLL